MPFALEHTVTMRSAEGFVSVARANGFEDTTAPWGMEFVVGTDADGNEVLQAIKVDAAEWSRERLEAWLAERKIVGEVEWARDVTDRMANVPALRWQEEAGETYRVLDVPVFRLGNHRGFCYDRAWAERALGNFRADADAGRLPSVILGHSMEGVEKPAVGFLDRLRRIGDTLYADLKGLHSEVFRQIRRGMWPQRSVEVVRGAARVAALALLGSSSPYHKFPALGESFGESGSGGSVWKPWETDRFEEEDTRVSDVKNERAKVAEEKARADRLEAEVAELTEKNRRMEIERFRQELFDLGYAPAVIDSPEIAGWVDAAMKSPERVMFGEGDEVTGLEVPRRVMSLLADRAGRRALFVETGECARVESVNGP